MSSNNDSSRSKELGKKVHADFVAVLEALKANGCISEYSIIGHEIKPEWKEGGIECAFRELTSNIKPFGLAKSQRGILMQVLPKKEQGKIYSAFLDQYSQ